jgi:hypothetical protein
MYRACCWFPIMLRSPRFSSVSCLSMLDPKVMRTFTLMKSLPQPRLLGSLIAFLVQPLRGDPTGEGCGCDALDGETETLHNISLRRKCAEPIAVNGLPVQ